VKQSPIRDFKRDILDAGWVYVLYGFLKKEKDVRGTTAAKFHEYGKKGVKLKGEGFKMELGKRGSQFK